MNKYDVILAGLLHDIGKFFEKANAKGTNLGGIEVSTVHHGITSGNFVFNFRNKLNQAGFDTEAVKEMVQRHHEYKSGGPASVEDAQLKYRPYCYIIDKADNLSSSERLNTRSSDGNWQLRQLTNIFSLVAGQRYSQEAGIYGEVYNRVNSDNKLNTQATNQKMVESFIQEFDSLEVLTTNKTRESTQVERQQSFISKVDNLLKKYTWCYPSDTREYIRDISLYSHLQTTAMLAGVLYDDLTTNSEYKRGLESDKEALGWKFTEVSIKELRTESITIMQVHLANAIEFMSNVQVKNVQTIKNWINRIRDNFENRLIKNIGISSVNFICKELTGFTIITDNKTVHRIIEVTAEFNRIIPQPIGNNAIFFELAYSNVGLDTLFANNTGEVLGKLHNCIKKQYSDRKQAVEYIGFESLVVDKKSGTWGNIEISNVTSEEMIASKERLSFKQSETWNKLSTKALSLVKIRIDNYDELISIIMGRSFDNSDKHIGTICRLSTIMDRINSVVGLTVNNCIYLNRGNDGITLITTIDKAMQVGSVHRRIINKQTICTLKTSLFIETIIGKNLNKAFRSLEYNEARNSQENVIVYDGIKVEPDLFNSMPEILNMVIESAKLKEGKSIMYKLMEFTHMYKQYCISGDTSYLMFIPRFEYYAKRNLNMTNISEPFKAYITNKFNKLKLSSDISKCDTELLVLGSLIYSAIQILKIGGNMDGR